MIERSIASRYSKVLFELDAPKGNYEKRIGDFDFLLALLENNPTLKTFLKAPQIPLEEKKSVLAASLSEKYDPAFMHFLFYLIQKRRFDYLKSIALEYRMMVNKHLGIWEASVITPTPIDQDAEKKMTDKLERYFHRKIKINQQIDPKMIGGAVLVIGNDIIDWSVRGRLRKMKEYLMAAPISARNENGI